MDLKEQIKIALGLNDSKEIKFEWQSKTEDGTILVSSADELETGVDQLELIRQMMFHLQLKKKVS